jgi:hypothetical protein
MKYARPLLITFSVVIAASVAIAVAAAVAIAVAILNGLTVYNDDSVDPVIASSTFDQQKALKAIDDKSAIRDNESSNTITAKANEKPEQKTVPIENNKNPPEPSNKNADMPATGEFADQVNFPAQKGNCNDACADGSTVNMKATGEFADQINSDDIIVAAKTKGFDRSETKKLVDVPANSAPPTELGVYTPPTNN